MLAGLARPVKALYGGQELYQIYGADGNGVGGQALFAKGSVNNMPKRIYFINAEGLNYCAYDANGTISNRVIVAPLELISVGNSIDRTELAAMGDGRIMIFSWNGPNQRTMIYNPSKSSLNIVNTSSLGSSSSIVESYYRFNKLAWSRKQDSIFLLHGGCLWKFNAGYWTDVRKNINVSNSSFFIIDDYFIITYHSTKSTDFTIYQATIDLPWTASNKAMRCDATNVVKDPRYNEIFITGVNYPYDGTAVNLFRVSSPTTPLISTLASGATSPEQVAGSPNPPSNDYFMLLSDVRNGKVRKVGALNAEIASALPQSINSFNNLFYNRDNINSTAYNYLQTTNGSPFTCRNDFSGGKTITPFSGCVKSLIDYDVPWWA